MRRQLIGMMLVLTALACGGDKGTGPGASMSGNFTLRTVGGANVPAAVYDQPDGKVEIVGGNLNFNSDKTWTGQFDVRGTDRPSGIVSPLTLNGNGTYTLNGSTVTIHDATDGTDFTATLNGNTLTASIDLGLGDGAFTMVFQK
jgi:hypothetical protein